MTVANLLRAGGGLADEAYASKAELTRYQVVNGDVRRTQLINVDLTGVLRGDATANIRLEPFDDLSVKEIPEWHSQESVSLSGEVRFPGTYAIRRGETLRSVLARAGGLTEFAFPEGSVFTREELKRREQDQIDMLGNRMQRDLTFMALQGAAVSTVGGTGGGGGLAALSLGQALVAQLRDGKAVGRLVIDLPRAMSAKPGSPDDVILRNGDSLVVPRYQQEVTVIGEVQTTTSHLFRPDLTRDDYISLSGGTTNRADKGKIYVVRANGSVVASSGSRWFQTSHIQIKPGDTIVVPLDTERLPPLPFWQAVTGILYNLAIVGVALHSF
jgi:polysaccharide biosynthesis/export protein